MPNTQKRTVPEFMGNEKSKNSAYKISAVLGIKYNEENKLAHTFVVQTFNTTNGKYIGREELAPELIRHRFKLGKIYKNGQYIGEDKSQKEDYFVIDTNNQIQEKISHVLSEEEILKILDNNSFNKIFFGANFCYKFETEDAVLIVPSYAVALYYHIRSSSMKEAYFKGNPDGLYDKVLSNLKDKNDALLVLNSKAALFDGPFIYRILTDEQIARVAFTDFFSYLSGAYSKGKLTGKKSDIYAVSAKFPTREQIRIKARYVELKPADGNQKRRLFVNEILNDSSSLDFEKLTVVKGVKKNPDDNPKGNQITIKGRNSKRTLEKTVNKTPSSLYSTNVIRDKEDEVNMTLQNKEVVYAGFVEQDNKRNRVNEGSSGDTSLGFSSGSGSGDEKVRQASLEGKGENQKEPIVKPPNFDIFRECIEFLDASGVVNDIELDESYRTVPPRYNKDDSLADICSICGRLKQYITASFVFNDINVVLVEVEAEKADFATWVLFSAGNIDQSHIDSLLLERYANGAKIEDLQNVHAKRIDIKFSTKKHPFGDDNGNITDEDIERWAARLLSKIKTIHHK